MQYRLRTLFIVVTLVSMALAVVAWRQARQRRLVKLVEAYIAARDAQRYDDAHALARNAAKEFPDEIVIQSICEQSEMFQALARGEKVDFTFKCGGDSQVCPTVNLDFQFKWDEHGNPIR